MCIRKLVQPTNISIRTGTHTGTHSRALFAVTAFEVTVTAIANFPHESLPRNTGNVNVGTVDGASSFDFSTSQQDLNGLRCLQQSLSTTHNT